MGIQLAGPGGAVAEEIATDAIELTKRVVPYQHGLILR